MRSIQPAAFTVYKLDELSEESREKAIENVRQRLSGDWWDSGDIDDISDVMRYTLANSFGTPGHGEFGVGDFPGIPGVKLDSWDLDRGEFLGLQGTLTRENAPSLPWDSGLVEVVLTCRRDYTIITAEFDDTLTPDDVTLVDDSMSSAIKDAMRAAIRDGRAEIEYMTGTERATEVASDREFLADGTLLS